jgi:hypothetical protein
MVGLAYSTASIKIVFGKKEFYDDAQNGSRPGTAPSAFELLFFSMNYQEDSLISVTISHKAEDLVPSQHAIAFGHERRACGPPTLTCHRCKVGILRINS